MKLRITANSFKDVFLAESVICRIIAAWCTFVVLNLFRGGNFNALSYTQDTSILAMSVIIIGCFLFFSLVKITLTNLETDSWFLILSASACVVRWLLTYNDSNNKILFSLATAAAFCLFALYFLKKNTSLLEKWNPGKKTQFLIYSLLGLVCFSVIAIITGLRYLTFSSPNFDFGLFANMFHNMKETGIPLASSERDVVMSHFAVHISPVFYLLLPIYCVFPSPITLQISQAVVVASGLIPTILLCRHLKFTPKTTLFVSFVYALYPALSSSCTYDIHENCFLTPLLLWMFYFLEREKYPPMYLFAFLTLTVKEDAAVYVILFALFVIFSKKKYIHGIILAAAASVYFAVSMNILENASEYYANLYSEASPNPQIAGPMINRFDNLINNKEDGIIGAVKTALLNPGYLLTQLFTTSDGGWGKLSYVLQIFLPLGFLPFFTNKPSRWLLLTPILMNVLTNYKFQYITEYQYHFGIIAFLIYASILNLHELKAPSKRTIMTVAAVFCCCLYISTVLPKAGTYIKRYSTGYEKYAQMEEILEQIPDDASLSVSTFLLAHVADREEVYAINYHENEGNVDYVIFDKRYSINDSDVAAYLVQGYRTTNMGGDHFLILEKTD